MLIENLADSTPRTHPAKPVKQRESIEKHGQLKWYTIESHRKTTENNEKRTKVSEHIAIIEFEQKRKVME